MLRIFVTAAGSPGAIGFVRSLRSTGDNYYFIGADSHKYKLQRSEVDERYLIPFDYEDDYFDILYDLLSECRPDLLHIQSPYGMQKISSERAKLPCQVLLPSHETILVCGNKFTCFKIWKTAGVKVPETMLITSPSDLDHVFSLYGPNLWLRLATGSTGKGSLVAKTREEAYNWINFWKGWGNFTAAELLDKTSTTWHSLWLDGRLIVAQERKRLYWDFAHLSISGIGITGAAATGNDPLVTEVALSAILSIDKQPNGLFSVDLTYDKTGVPNPTEINTGRFISTIHFFAEAGLNMPDIFVKCALYGKSPNLPVKVNPLPANLVWIRGMDTNPIFTDSSKIEKAAERLAIRRKSSR